MAKGFDFKIRAFFDAANFVGRNFSAHHHAAEAHFLQIAGAFKVHDAHLGRGVKFEIRQVFVDELSKADVLHDEGVHAHFVEIRRVIQCPFAFFVGKQNV